jgi:hypothetical protein
MIQQEGSQLASRVVVSNIVSQLSVELLRHGLHFNIVNSSSISHRYMTHPAVNKTINDI